MQSSGRDLIRTALLHHQNKLLTIAEAVDCGPEALASFARNQGATLSVSVLEEPAGVLFHGTYEASTDRLMLTGAPFRNIIEPKIEGTP